MGILMLYPLNDKRVAVISSDLEIRRRDAGESVDLS